MFIIKVQMPDGNAYPKDTWVPIEELNSNWLPLEFSTKEEAVIYCGKLSQEQAQETTTEIFNECFTETFPDKLNFQIFEVKPATEIFSLTIV